MVKITYNGNRYTRRRLPTGRWITFRANQTVEVESERIAKELEGNRDFSVEGNYTSKVGAGIKTHVKPSKLLGKLDKSRERLDKGKQAIKKEVKCPKGSYKCKSVCKCKGLKKPKGLRKPKRAD